MIPVVETIKATLPMDGLAMKTLFTVGSMLPCVGIAILLKQVVNKVTDFVPFFVGFTLAAGVGLNLVSVTVVAGMFAIIHYQTSRWLEFVQKKQLLPAAGLLMMTMTRRKYNYGREKAF